MEGLSLDPRILYNNIKESKYKNIKKDLSFEKLLDKKTEENRSTQKEQRLAELKKACVAMESLFVEQVLNAMRKTVSKNFLNGGFAEEVFEDMLYQEYALKIAESEKFGISNIMYNQLKDFI